MFGLFHFSPVTQYLWFIRFIRFMRFYRFINVYKGFDFPTFLFSMFLCKCTSLLICGKYASHIEIFLRIYKWVLYTFLIKCLWKFTIHFIFLLQTILLFAENRIHNGRDLIWMVRVFSVRIKPQSTSQQIEGVPWEMYAFIAIYYPIVDLL